jgi:hypothetical protein
MSWQASSIPCYNSRNPYPRYLFGVELWGNFGVIETRIDVNQLVNLDLDSLVVYKETMNSKIELRDEAEILKSLNFYNSIKLVVEKGKPMRNGEINIKFSYFDANAEAHLRPLFALPLPGKLTVAEAKKAVCSPSRELVALCNNC